MSLSSHLNELQKKHETLTQKVESAQRRPAGDDLQIGEMKKQKLRLKEQIQKYQPS